MFSAVDAVRLRPLPFANADRAVRVSPTDLLTLAVVTIVHWGRSLRQSCRLAARLV